MSTRMGLDESALEACLRAHPAGRARAGAVGLEVDREPRLAQATRGVVPALPVKLTARGRRVLAGVGLLVALGLSAALGAAWPGSGWSGSGWFGSELPGSGWPGSGSPALVAPRSAHALHLVDERSVVVRPGDTLWSIAGPLAGSDDVRGVVWRIRELNGLRQADLVPGQVLRLP